MVLTAPLKKSQNRQSQGKDKMAFSQLVSPSLIEPEGSQPCSQEPACVWNMNIVHPVTFIKTRWKSSSDYTQSTVKERK